jgi:two-component system cell cycle response regulator DivK
MHIHPNPINAQNQTTNIEWQQYTILIAEDVDYNIDLIKEMLFITGISILIAENGQEAIEMCKLHPEINLVLMDLQMPIINGYEATKAIKQFRPELPIIAQTAYALSDDKGKVLAAGCDDYIAKPFNSNALIAILNGYLQRS